MAGKRGKQEKVLSEKEREKLCFLLAMISIGLGALTGYISLRLAVRQALAGGLIFLIVYYQAMKRAFSKLEKDELRGNTIFPFLTTWYAVWVFLYNYFNG